ncbi:cytosolic sulfotransferase 5-like [Lolium rigidum]|uniref:cytosolic sulfotransferase 5-like n=1 Tax=Lolium rigidum TaxID=89674 RepID=UPI001F5DBEEB|nr:cytosolic sulfotransferase 5-like [Lolium rigidum]
MQRQVSRSQLEEANTNRACTVTDSSLPPTAMVGGLEEGVSSSGHVGPMPFKDLAGVQEQDDEQDMSTPREDDEYAGIISALPSATNRFRGLCQYQGAWMLHRTVAGVISVQRRFVPRPGGGDVLLASPPKCGTTWVKALSFATMARAAYPPSAGDHPLLRLNPHDCVPSMEDLFGAGREAQMEVLPSPRLMHTHMHHPLLPPSLAHNPDCKIVYVCREPKDMMVSLWHFTKAIVTSGGRTYSFSDVLEWTCEGKSPYGPFWDHLLGYWRASKATPERVLFLKYEEMLADQVGTIRELARFLGVPFTTAEEAAGLPLDIAKLCSIDTMRGLDANKTGKSWQFFKFPNESFFRKGVVGDWVNHMTPEMARKVDAIVEEKLRGSGLTFTS